MTWIRPKLGPKPEESQDFREILGNPGKSWDFREILGNPRKSQDFQEIPGNPRISGKSMDFWSLLVVSEVIFWPENRPETRNPGKSWEILGNLVRAPIDHFLRGKCDKCPPRVRRVKSGFPKNGHASGHFLDKKGLRTPPFWPKSAIKGRTEPLKIRKKRVFFTFFRFFRKK